jgi:hypothetical protein
MLNSCKVKNPFLVEKKPVRPESCERKLVLPSFFRRRQRLCCPYAGLKNDSLSYQNKKAG